MADDLTAVLARALPALCACYRADCSDALIDAWSLALDGEDHAAVEVAMLAALRERDRRYLPTPGEILAAIHGTPRDDAIESWPAALEAIRTGRESTDALVDRTLRTMGGLTVLGDRVVTDRQWTRREYLETYCAVERSGAREVRETLPRLGAGAERLADGIG